MKVSTILMILCDCVMYIDVTVNFWRRVQVAFLIRDLLPVKTVDLWVSQEHRKWIGLL